MILVVFGHVLLYGYGTIPVASFQNLFVLFRMPLFFFVSGFLFYKRYEKNPHPCHTMNMTFLLGKMRVQLVPTAFFLLLNVWLFDASLYETVVTSNKGGYWFTITLFEFFLSYILVQSIMGLRIGRYFVWILGVIYILIGMEPFCDIIGRMGLDFDMLSCIKLRYFVFFCFGTLFREHFSRIEKVFNSSLWMSVSVVTTFLVCFYLYKFGVNRGVERAVLGGIAGLGGILVVFCFFYRYQKTFEQNTRLGGFLQYVGKRTLDVYLLHYFFIPRNLGFMNDWFNLYPNPSMEFIVSVVLALVTIVLCLVTSNVIRLSPFLAHWLFGVKYEVHEKK